MFKIILLANIIILITPIAQAANFYFCTQTNNYVLLGDSLNQAKSACGKPQNTQEKKIQPQETREIIRWVYDFQPNAFSRHNKQKYKQNSLIVDFYNDKAIKILVEGKSVTTSNFCSDNIDINLGISQLILYQICRYPSLKKTFQEPISQNKISQTTLTYDNGPLATPTNLIFQNEKLLAIEYAKARGHLTPS